MVNQALKTELTAPLTENPVAWANFWIAQGLVLIPLLPADEKPGFAGRPLSYGDENHHIADPRLADIFAKIPDYGMGVVHDRSRTCCLDVGDYSACKSLLAAVAGIDLDELIRNHCSYQGQDNRVKILFRPAVDDAIELLQNRSLAKGGQNGEYFSLHGHSGHDVLPPSLHPVTRKPYAAVADNALRIAPLPRAIKDLWVNWDSYKTAFAQHLGESQPAVTAAELIQGFKATYSMESLLSQFEYRQAGERWLSPYASTDNPGITPLPDSDKWYCHDGSNPLSRYRRGFDVFDVLCECRFAGKRGEALQFLAKTANVRLQSPAEARLEQLGKRLQLPGSASQQDPWPVILKPEPLLRFTDEWNGWLLASNLGGNLFYLKDETRLGWHVWNGHCWEKSEHEAKALLAGGVLSDLVMAYVNKLQDSDSRELRKKHAARCGSARVKINARYEAQDYLLKALNELDQNPYLFNVSNGTLDIATGEFRAHRRADFLTKGVPLGYDPTAQCPKFDAALRRALTQYQDAERTTVAEESTAELIRYFWRIQGYCLTRKVNEKFIVLLLGEGDTGKSLIDVVPSAVLGAYATSGVTDLIRKKRRDSHPTVDNTVVGFNKVTIKELGEEFVLDDETIKVLTGETENKTRGIGKEYIANPITAKIVILSNHFPVFNINDSAMLNRIKVLPFRNVLAAAEIKRGLLDEILTEELPGVLNRMLAGARDWQVNGMQHPPLVDAELDIEINKQDNVAGQSRYVSISN